MVKFYLGGKLTSYPQHMREMTNARRTTERKEERDDLFTNPLEPGENELDVFNKVSDQETFGQYLSLVLGTQSSSLCTRK